MTKDELIAFEKDIAEEWQAGHIRGPVHLSGGNEDALIDIFKGIEPTDWVFSTWRSHYHALLKGVPPKLVKAEIMAGRSISLQFPEYRFHTSAIVGGILPIALGIAMMGQKVWCFVGDMASQTGMLTECTRYAAGKELPFYCALEDNSRSVETPTAEVWGFGRHAKGVKMTGYSYEPVWPHQGTGKYVNFDNFTK